MTILNLPDVPETAFIMDNPELKKRLVKLITYIIDDDIDLTPIERFTYAMNWNKESYQFCKASANLVFELMGVQHDR